MVGQRVEVVNSKGCSKLFPGLSSSFTSINNSTSHLNMSPSSSAISESMVTGPFAGLTICVTGLSKEARMQVMAATERLDGQYSSCLHPQCTHLVVQHFNSCSGRKFEHALKHGLRNGLFIVTLGWFVDSVRRNMRMSETLYSVKRHGGNDMPLEELKQFVRLPGADKSCLPRGAFEDGKPLNTMWGSHLEYSRREITSDGRVLSSTSIYIDSNVSTEMKKEVVDAVTAEGATILEHWFVGCNVNYVICEDSSVKRYIGHTNYIVTPLWILKTVKEKSLQRLVHLSSDLARQVAVVIENAQSILYEHDTLEESTNPSTICCKKFASCGNTNETNEVRKKVVDMAKSGVRTRRAHRMQSCQMPIQPITPSSIMDSICWSVSEPASSACIYMELTGADDKSEQQNKTFFDSQRDSELLSENLSCPLTESEKSEVVFKNHFLTILFPIDRFGELGPSSRMFFSNGGFSRLQILGHIYDFYQENLSLGEIGMAINTDSRHADRLRSLYASKESLDQGFVAFKRIEFLGSRKSFEALKRVSGENNTNVYQLLIRA